MAREDFDDLFQECLIQWLFVKDQYKPDLNVTLRTFLNRVVKNKLLDIARSKGCDKRSPFYKSLSLDEFLEDEEKHHRKVFLMFWDENFDRLEKEELPGLLAKVMEKLSFRQKQVCHLLGEKGLNQKEASLLMKIPRTTLQEEIKRIREIFRKAGLENYLA